MLSHTISFKGSVVRHFLFVSVLCLVFNVSLSAQEKDFHKSGAFEDWVMNYYKNPEPQHLWYGFTHMTKDKEIRKSGARSLMVVFFASALRNDTLRQTEFFNKLSNSGDKDLVYGFGLVLWNIQTDFSLKKLTEFQNLKSVKRYRSDFEALQKTELPDLLNDPVEHPHHLDMLWADFFATGSELAVLKIITNLSELESEHPFEVATAGSAKWSLTSNGIQHDAVHAIIRKRIDDEPNELIKSTLQQIIEQIENEKTASSK
jgi:hypothetical protein